MFPICSGCFGLFSALRFSARRCIAAGLVLLGASLIAPRTLAQSSETPSRITAAVNDEKLVVLRGNTHPLAKAKYDRGAAPDSLPMERMLLVLSRSQEQNAALDKLLAEQQDPQSPHYHQWLTTEQFAEQFGPSDQDVEQVTQWLSGHGFSVAAVSKGRTTIEFSGTAGQVREAFHTEIHKFAVPQDGRMVEHWANASDPQIPAALAPVVGGVVSLHNFGLKAMHRTLGPVLRHADSATVTPEFSFGYEGQELYGLGPTDWATQYNVMPLWNAGITGSGETIAIVGQSDIKLTDVAAFRSAFGLPAKAPVVITNGADPGTDVDDEEESDLDVEWSGAVAKDATIAFVTSASTNASAGVDLSAEYIVDNKTASIMSMSYGECEQFLGTSGNEFYSNLWSEAAGKGITVFVSTGDSGSASCDDGSNNSAAEYGLTVSGIASTPYNVAVGGTDLADENFITGASSFSTYWSTTNNATTGASLKKYVPETVWNDSCAVANEAFCNNPNDVDYLTLGGGSGGASSCTAVNVDTGACSAGYAKPSWQTGTGVPADGHRDIPDVSLFSGNGARGSFYLICDTDASPDGTCDFSNSTDAVYLALGGTSAASPSMAGIQALINQKVGSAQGNINTTLYALAAKETLSGCNSADGTSGSGTACYFNDITTDTNAMPCINGTANCTVTTASDQYGILSGYAAGTGYDRASGLGSVNANNLVNGWPGATAVAKVTLSATTVAFASQTAGTTSAAKTVTLTNSGNAALTGVAITLGGTGAADFVETNNCGTSVAAAATCTITLAFKPAAAAAYTATVSIKDSVSGSPQTIALSGTGIVATPAASLSTTSEAFGSQTVATTSAAKTVTLTNSGTAALTGVAISLAGTNPTDFVESNNCAANLAVAASCIITLEFKPAAAAAYTATVDVKDNATGSPQTVTLTGTGVAAAPKVTLSATSEAFATQAEATTSAAKTVTLTNSGTASLTGVAISLVGTNPTDFVESNNCTATIAANASCTITLEFKPAAAAAYTATVDVKDSATGSPQTIALSGTGYVPTPKVTLSATSEAFATQAEATTSAAKTVTLTNSGTASLTGVAISLAGTNPTDFVESNNCAATIAVNASCTITLEFKPAAAAAYTATVDVKDNATGSPQTIALTGTGYVPAPKVTLSATSEAFGSQTSGTASAAKTVTLTNSGTASLTGVAIALAGTNPADFVETNNCSATLAVNASCTISLEFKPAAAAAYSATVDVKDNATGSPQTIALSGTGIVNGPVVTLSPASVAFGSVAIGSTSAAATITVTNSGNATLTGITPSLAGTNPTDFEGSSTCETTLAAGASCTIAVEFVPAAAASYSATLEIADNASGSPQKVSLTGTGVTPAPKVTLSATSVAFGSQAVETASAAKTVTLTNSGTANLTGLAITLAGTNPTDFLGSNGCTPTLTAGQSCSITLEFKPAVAGTFSATVEIKDNATGSPQTIALTGTGTNSATAGSIVIYAGQVGDSGYTGNSGSATQATFYYAEGTATDASGNLYIADSGNNVIRKVNASTGIITTVAGNGYGAGMIPGGYTGDGGPALDAELGGPFGVTVDKAGNLYIADTSNSAIRKVAASTGTITTVAGNGNYGYSGDGGLAVDANLGSPKAVAVDSAGNLYISDATNYVIRKVTASTGIITTIAGGGSGCSQETDAYGDGCPAVDAILEVGTEGTGTGGIAVDASGNVYLADPDVETVRKIVASTGKIVVVAGNGYINPNNGQGGYSGNGGPATSAELNLPRDVRVDGAGNIFFSDAQNNIIREVSAATGKISTVAGVQYTSGGTKESTPVIPFVAATGVTFNIPAYISLDPSGNLFITDVNNFVVYKAYGIGAATPVL
jgi:hypothetical protein